ncbi:MAG: hypothetical protein EU551_00485 [Promethearchaeota archaeon]|nr:MAG: hypothetical protein EU551_00485 [Candidatus Lokiarchaeota archaeon]
MSKIESDNIEIRKSKNNLDGSEDMRKSRKCANLIQIVLNCEFMGNDIKPLNSSTGKGSYLLKLGTKKVDVPYKKSERHITLSLYKIKGLRGFLRHAAEKRLLKLKEEGKTLMGPCTPNANYPNKDILEQHLKMGYHEQGSCNPHCFMRRMYGSLDTIATVEVFPTYIAKADNSNIPNEIEKYIEENISDIFNMGECIIYSNDDTVLKTETCNIINRKTNLAVNNFMKHIISGVFPFKVVFNCQEGDIDGLLENIGFFITSLMEINSGKVKLGADKRSGSGRVKVRINSVITNYNGDEFKEFVSQEKENKREIGIGDLIYEEKETSYILSDEFMIHSIEMFNKKFGR